MHGIEAIVKRGEILQVEVRASDLDRATALLEKEQESHLLRVRVSFSREGWRPRSALAVAAG